MHSYTFKQDIFFSDKLAIKKILSIFLFYPENNNKCEKQHLELYTPFNLKRTERTNT